MKEREVYTRSVLEYRQELRDLLASTMIDFVQTKLLELVIMRGMGGEDIEERIKAVNDVANEMSSVHLPEALATVFKNEGDHIRVLASGGQIRTVLSRN